MSVKQWWKDWSVEMTINEDRGVAKVEIKIPNAEGKYADVVAPIGLAYFLHKVFTDAFTLIEEIHENNRAVTSVMVDTGKWNFKDKITAAFGILAGGKFYIDDLEVIIAKQLKSAIEEDKKYVG